MVPKKTFCHTSTNSYAVGSSKYDLSKEIPSFVKSTNDSTLPYFEGYNRHSTLTKKELSLLKISYNILASISFELPSYGNTSYGNK